MKKKGAKDEKLKDLLGSLPKGGYEEVKLAFAKFGTELSSDQEARLRELLEKRKGEV